MAFCDAGEESVWMTGYHDLESDQVLHSDSLIVQLPVIHIETSSVIVALLQLQVRSVKSHGEAAIAPVRQFRCGKHC